MKYSMPKLLKDYFPEGTTNGADMPIEYDRLKVIIFQAEDEAKLDSRLIKYHLTEEDGRNYRGVVVSSPNFVVPLINDKTKVVVLIGAEAFDAEKRVLRTSCYKETLREFLDGAGQRIAKTQEDLKRNKDDKTLWFENLKVIVCAESFKEVSNLREHLDDQYDKIELFEREFITTILTEEKEYN